MSLPPPLDLDATLRRFLAEDLGAGDVTSEAVVPAGLRARAVVRAKGAGVVAGADLFERVVRLLDPTARASDVLADGVRVVAGVAALHVEADARALLAAERTALNLLQRMSGIATLTAHLVDAVAGTGAKILDTRKTAPGLRWFDKRAVAAGGGVNHRLGLWDQVLVKSNHLVLRDGDRHEPHARRPIEAAVRDARARAPRGTRVEVEVFDADEALRAAEAGAQLVLLDNLEPVALAAAVRAVRARFTKAQVELEASGGVNLGNARHFAEAGVDRISVGATTHSAAALDLSLVLERPDRRPGC
jgi:nicotinate-nucleotide pyrophosphorylase (carboxylating)